MAIPEDQLEVWSHQGATTQASNLYARIQSTLKTDSALLARNFEVFLQGSYRNSTNIRGDSDVDVVAMLTDTFMPDYTLLDDYTKSVVQRANGPATYHLTDFRRDVSAAIRRGFPAHQITEGGKSIKIPRTSNNIPADVVPCLEYRRYRTTRNLPGVTVHDDGIWLWDVKKNKEAISFPKQTYDNGVAKHARTKQWYKPTVRIFKNARGWMVDRGLIQQDTASSHAIECLIYNVPDNLFGTSYASTCVNTLNWLNSADLSNFVCQNGLQSLFGPDKWTIPQARAFISAAIVMWNDWGQGNARLRI